MIKVGHGRKPESLEHDAKTGKGRTEHVFLGLPPHLWTWGTPNRAKVASLLGREPPFQVLLTQTEVVSKKVPAREQRPSARVPPPQKKKRGGERGTPESVASPRISKPFGSSRNMPPKLC